MIRLLFFVVLIFFYLVWVVVPLFLPASVHHSFSLPAFGHTIAEPVLLAADENAEVGFIIEKYGTYRFLSTGNGQTLDEGLLALGSGNAVAQDDVALHPFAAQIEIAPAHAGFLAGFDVLACPRCPRFAGS